MSVLLLFLSMLLSVPAAAETRSESELAEAARLEASGDLAAASRAYRKWLSGNPASPQLPDIFSRYFAIERDFQTLLSAGREFLESTRTLSGAGTQILLVAQLLDISGRTEEARDAYRMAYVHGAPLSALIASLLLSLEMNDTKTLEEASLASYSARSVGGIPGLSPAWASLLEACSLLRQGDRDSAKTRFKSILDEAGQPEAQLKALWLLHAQALAAGEAKGMSEASDLLGSLYPRSPEYAMVADQGSGGDQGAGKAQVFPVVLPDQFFQAQSQSPSEPTAPPADPTVPPEPRWSVQAGAFKERENADDLAGELMKRGYAPTIREDMVQGGKIFRVRAGTSLSAPEASALLKKLASEGFAGLIVADR